MQQMENLLGGQFFFVPFEAKNIFSKEDFLKFELRTMRGNANRVEIQKNVNGTYDIRLFKVNQMKRQLHMSNSVENVTSNNVAKVLKGLLK